ncbi:MAG: peptidoglycan editing factor PgeF, partial [Prevotella sp.]|nr:peptidoglycan editing factor PgeF [Prevotella sp.]
SDLEKVKLLNGIDALVTDQRNICIGVTTADCVPILIFDDVKKVFAAVHAGWKGTVNKITERTIETMVQHFGCDDPQALLIGIGPCISQEKFEVGGEVSEAFRQAGFPMERIAYMNEYTGKMHIDLQEANKIILTDCGIPSTHIEQANLCTYSNPDKFFSARRQGFHSGRMLTGGILR